MAVRRRKSNPWLAVLNKPRHGALIGHGVREIVYDRHATHGKGPWVHKFRRGDVDVRGLPSGKVVVETKAGVPVWEKDGRAGWLSNPAGKKNKGLPLLVSFATAPGDERDLFEYMIARGYGAILQGESGAVVVRVPPNETPTQVIKAARAARAIRIRGFKTTSDFRSLYQKKSNRGGKMKHKRKTTAKRNRSRRRPPKGFATWKAYMRSIRPNRGRRRTAKPKGSTVKRRHRSSKRRHGRRRSKNRAVVVHRIVHRNRGRRRNPPMLRGIVGQIVDAGKGGALVVAGKATSRILPHLVGITPVGYLGLAAQAVAGGAVGLLAGRFIGRENGRVFLFGVASNVIESVIRGFNIPVLSPGLADETELYALAGYPQPRALPPAGGKGQPGLRGYPPRREGMGDEAGMPLLVMG